MSGFNWILEYRNTLTCGFLGKCSCMAFLRRGSIPAAAATKINVFSFSVGSFASFPPTVENFRSLPNGGFTLPFSDPVTLTDLRTRTSSTVSIPGSEKGVGLRFYFMGYVQDDGNPSDFQCIPNDRSLSECLVIFQAAFPGGGGICNIIVEVTNLSEQNSPPSPLSRLRMPTSERPLGDASAVTVKVQSENVFAYMKARSVIKQQTNRSSADSSHNTKVEADEDAVSDEDRGAEEVRCMRSFCIMRFNDHVVGRPQIISSDEY